MNQPACKKSIEINGVRITPAVLEFLDSFEGSTYKKTIEIQNIGSSRVFINIGKPSSYLFEIKSLSRGQYLSPGLSIVKLVKLTYTHLGNLNCVLPIYIGKTRHEYQILVKPSAAVLKVSPETIDFGILDIGLTSAMRILQIRNEGSKAARFSIDISKKDPQVMAEPNRGLVQPRGVVDIRIKLATFKKRTLMHEFWIICDTPIRVPLKGSVIFPKFEVLHPKATDKLTLIDFPTTYIGANCVQTLVIRNYSSLSTMFCVMGEINAQCVSLKSARELDKNYRNFNVFPKDGHLEPKEARIIYFTFRPQKLNPNEKLPEFYLCTFAICRVPCKEMDLNDISEIVCLNDYNSQLTEETRTSTPSMYSILNASNEIDLFGFESEIKETADAMSKEESKTTIRVFLHGIAKIADVQVIPSELSLANLRLSQRESRVLQFSNLQDKLPIILRYNKVPFVDMENKNIFLKPSEKVQVFVYITPYSIGVIKTQINFDLMYYDDPKVNNDYKVVGKICVPLIFEVVAITRTPEYRCSSSRHRIMEEKSKDSSANTSNNIKKIANEKSRAVKNILPAFDVDNIPEFSPDFTDAVTNYYLESSTEETLEGPSKQTLSDYDITDEGLLLCTTLPCPRPKTAKVAKRVSENSFIPLTPSELYEIRVYPKVITTGEIAANYKYSFTVKVKNTSSHSIHLLIRADKATLLFPGGDRKVIQSHSEFDANLEYITSSPGFYTAAINFIVNHSNVYVVTLLADVVSKTLRLSTNNLKFEPNKTQRYIDIYNPLNKSVSFRWSFTLINFVVEPMYGVIPAKRLQSCLVAFMPCNIGPLTTEIEFYSGDKRNMNVTLTVDDANKDYFFVEKIVNFDAVPLNISVTKNAILKNLGPRSIFYTIQEPEPIPGISITPSSGVVRENSENIVTVTVKIAACVKFSLLVVFNIIRAAPLELCIKGRVIYPSINFVPHKLQLKKIPSSSFDVLRFKVENKSAALATVNFTHDQYCEYEFSESENFYDPKIEKAVPIAANSCIYLYLHFCPTDVASGTFYLPFIINDILGPPINTDVTTTQVKYFLTENVPDTEPIEVPHRLTLPTILRRTTEPKIKLSKKIIEFKYAPWQRSCKTEYELVISNPQKETEEFCIRIDDLRHPFALTHSRGRPTINYPWSIVGTLKAKEEIVLTISFNPDSFGNFRAALPLFLRNDYVSRIHNTIYLLGSNPHPTIDSDDFLVSFTPCLSTFTINGYFNIKMSNHLNNCVLSGESNLVNFYVSIPDEYYIKNVDGAAFNIKVKTSHSPRSRGIFSTFILLKCTCGASCRIPLMGAVENSYITNHSFIQTFMLDLLTNCETVMKIRALKSGGNVACESEIAVKSDGISETDVDNFFVRYAFYPHSSSTFAKYMDEAVKVAENWIYTQGFFGKHFYKIPEGIQLLPKTHKIGKFKKRQCLWIMPFAQLLINLVGEDMIEFLQLRPKPVSETERVMYCYGVYKRSTMFLEELGAFIPHIRPEFLLENEYYAHYMENINQQVGGRVFSPSQFSLLSKQMWLDLVLQTYKVLILFRLAVKDIPSYSEYSVPLQDNAKNLSHIEANKIEFIFSTNELMLLQWLEFNYNLINTNTWCKHQQVDMKFIDNFDHNLDDGLVLAAVIIAHCPYIKGHFHTLYLNPSSFEDNLHNAIKVTRALEMLNLSFSIKPQEIVQSHSLQMLMLVSYLFEVLPNLNPTEAIGFKAGLSTSITKSFKLINENDFQIAYKIMFFNNESKFFSTNKCDIIIQPNSYVKIPITYEANFLKPVTVTMVLSGECIGFRYAKSTALTLIGEPDITYMTSVFTVPSYLYKISEVSLTIKSPYAIPATYQLLMTFNEPNDLGDVSGLPSTYECIHLSTRRFHPQKGEYQFDEDGLVTLLGTTCALNNLTHSVWLYFTNSTVGDFAIKVNFVVHVTEACEVLNVLLPKHISGVYTHHRKRKDTQIVKIKIPCQNLLMWNAIKEMVLKVLTGRELEFWEHVLRKSAGIHLLQRLFYEKNLDSAAEVQSMFTGHNQYVIINENMDVDLPSTLLIEDEFATGYLEIPLEFKNTIGMPENFNFFLKSSDGLKLRHYITNFTYSENT